MRYERQIAIADFGKNAQEKIGKARVAVVGLGGLGSAASMYMVASGIGYVRIIDNDVVEWPDLNRQILYNENDIGRKKIEIAKEKLSLLNTEIKIDAIDERVTRQNAHELLGDVNAIVDCSDNFATRYILNEISVELRIPLFFASCREFQGILTVVIPGKTACIKCIFPSAPSPQKNPILGAVAGAMGCMQAAEVIKYFAGMEILKNKLLLYDAQFLRYKIIGLKRKKDCPVCGDLNES